MYIRTKDNIIPVSNVKTENGIKYATSILSGIEYSSKNENEKDVADTIDELCDEYVYQIDKYHYYNDDLETAMGLCDDITKIYGAIWVEGEHNEPILKSVAKMNDKGELELL